MVIIVNKKNYKNIISKYLFQLFAEAVFFVFSSRSTWCTKLTENEINQIDVYKYILNYKKIAKREIYQIKIWKKC